MLQSKIGHSGGSLYDQEAEGSTGCGGLAHKASEGNKNCQEVGWRPKNLASFSLCSENSSNGEFKENVLIYQAKKTSQWKCILTDTASRNSTCKVHSEKTCFEQMRSAKAIQTCSISWIKKATAKQHL